MSRIFFRRLLCPLIAAGLACAQGNGSTPSEAGDAPSGPSSAPVSSSGAIFYIRTDGGNAEQCNGLADAPYPGSGSNQACAWDHPFRAFPPGGAPRIAGGDTVLIAGGSYPMGFGAPGAEVCEEGGSFDCLMSPIPGGPDPARPTRILGAGWDAGCGDPPELWGTGRPWYIVNLTDSSNVEISCFEITDHSPCVENHSGGLACERETPPYGDWASYGLFAEDSSNVVLRDLNIHGLASGGVHAGRLSDWTVENVRIAGNGSVGWDGDLWDEGGDSNSGTMTFRRWVVEWNGCGETYPAGEPAGCWAQEAGGYGDGVGVGETGGDWVIEDSSFLHNTSDGLDLLYHTLGGSVVLNRVHAEGNAGNQIKVSGQMRLTDSVLVGNCAFFEGQPFAYLVDHCRALGNTLFVAFTGGEQSYIANSTFYGQGDGLISGGPREGFQCNGAETLIARNNVFLGDADFFDPSDLAFLFYQENCPGLKLNSDYNIVHNAKNIECNSAGDFVVSGARDICADPNLAGPLSGAEYGMSPNPDSPAVDAGDQGACASTDITGAPRPADGNKDGNPVCDIGAFELP
ncbi:MAG: hypothetical protein KPEEDBHJ_03190 [Anaerolineales bacterium]|nr:hypothetical protein [Anaerolineales bacterium]